MEDIPYDPSIPTKEKLFALKLIIQSDETRFRLLVEGPSVLAIKALDERLGRLENGGGGSESSNSSKSINSLFNRLGRLEGLKNSTISDETNSSRFHTRQRKNWNK